MEPVKPNCAPTGAGKHTEALANLPVLDGVRGLAVLLVLAFHFVFNAPDISTSALSANLLRKLSYFGWSGVDLFFVLSGFLITRILLHARSGPQYFRNFYARRILRIFPLYYATLSFVLLVLPALSSSWAERVRHQSGDQLYLWTYTFNVAPLFGRGAHVMDFGHFWSLCVEEHFYLFWPLLVWCLGARGVRRLCVVLVLGALACRMALRTAGVNPTAVFYFTPCRIDSLAMGAWVASYALDRLGRQRSIPAEWPRRAVLVGASALAALGMVAALEHGALRGGFWSQTIGLSAFGMLWTCFLVLGLRLRASSRLQRGLSSRPMRAFGKYSYGLYVLHPLVNAAIGTWSVSAITLLLGNMRGAANWIGVVLLFLILTAASFAVAFVTYSLLERPCLGLKRFFEYKAPATNRSLEPSAVN